MPICHYPCLVSAYPSVPPKFGECDIHCRICRIYRRPLPPLPVSASFGTSQYRQNTLFGRRRSCRTAPSAAASAHCLLPAAPPKRNGVPNPVLTAPQVQRHSMSTRREAYLLSNGAPAQRPPRGASQRQRRPFYSTIPQRAAAPLPHWHSGRLKEAPSVYWAASGCVCLSG